MSSGDVMRAMVERIEELEAEIEQWKAGQHPDDPDNHECECTQADLDLLEKELKGERAKVDEIAKIAAGLRNELAEERRDKRANETLRHSLKQSQACVNDLERKLRAATEVALTFEQKCERRVGKIGEFLCVSWQKHEKSQARWAYVADDLCKLLGVRFKEIT